MSMKLLFVCPKCGATGLEEILVGVVQTSPILAADCTDGLEYDTPTYEGGEVDRYQCSHCGWVIPGVTDWEGLVESLRTAQTNREKHK